MSHTIEMPGPPPKEGERMTDDQIAVLAGYKLYTITICSSDELSEDDIAYVKEAAMQAALERLKDRPNPRRTPCNRTGFRP